MTKSTLFKRVRQAVAGVATVAIVSTGLAQTSVQPAAADTTVAVDDRSVSARTASTWYTGVDAAFVAARVNGTGMRLAGIEVDSASPLRFTVRLVQNAGAYAVPGWWWYYGLTSQQLSAKLSEHSARIVDLEQYATSEGQRFAAVLVSNTGTHNKAWWYRLNTSPASIGNTLSANNARLVDLETYVIGSTRYYSAVMVRNAAPDNRSWSWWLGQTAAQISSRLSTTNSRLVDLERRSDGLFDVIMTANTGTEAKAWTWWVDLASPAAVSDKLAQTGMRLVDVEKYLVSGVTRYSAIMIDNLPAETRRVANIMAAGAGAGRYGLYLKPVGGGATHALYNDGIFEPASSIKVVHHLHSMRRVQAGTDNLDTNNFTYYRSPSDPTNGNICPADVAETSSNAVVTNLRDGLTRMMGVSDNRTTRGVQLRYGHPALNATVDAIGMSRTELRQVIGCGFRNGLRNDLTLTDIGKLYEGVANGTLLSGSSRTFFFSVMNKFTGASGLFSTIIDQEAAALGKSSTVASSFKNAMRSTGKGGSYDICTNTCNPYTYIRTGAGQMSVPFKANGVVTPRVYVYGSWIDSLTINCSAGVNCTQKVNADNAINRSTAEMFRSTIRAALATW